MQKMRNKYFDANNVHPALTCTAAVLEKGEPCAMRTYYANYTFAVAQPYTIKLEKFPRYTLQAVEACYIVHASVLTVQLLFAAPNAMLERGINYHCNSRYASTRKHNVQLLDDEISKLLNVTQPIYMDEIEAFGSIVTANYTH